MHQVDFIFLMQNQAEKEVLNFLLPNSKVKYVKWQIHRYLQ